MATLLIMFKNKMELPYDVSLNHHQLFFIPFNFI